MSPSWGIRPRCRRTRSPIVSPSELRVSRLGRNIRRSCCESHTPFRPLRWKPSVVTRVIAIAIIIIRFAGTIFPLGFLRSIRGRIVVHRSAGSDVLLVAYIGFPHQYYYVLLDVVSKLIRGVSQRTSSRQDSTWAPTRFFLDERFMREVTLFVRNF